MKILALCILALLCLLPLVVAAAQDDGGDPSAGANCGNSPCMTTYHNNNARTGLNTHETVLVANSTGWTQTFGTTSTVQTDGMIYAQPLYVSGVAWTGGTGTNCPSGTSKNMVYVATEGNTIYAIDADNYGLCASVSLNTGNTGGNTDAAMPVTDLPGGPCNNLTGSSTYGTVGVTGTPAIDPTNKMLFVVSAHKVTTSTGTSWTQRLNAVNITNLSLVTSSVDIPSAVNTSSGNPSFQARNESQRSGLLLTKIGSTGVNVYVAWGSFCDSNISGYGSFGLVSEFDFNYSNSTFGSSTESFYAEGTNTNTSYSPPAPAGVWMSGGAPAADGAGNVYVAVGNGNFEGTTALGLNFGNSIVKLGGSPFSVPEDYYTPNVWSVLNNGASGIFCSGSGSYCGSSSTAYLCKTESSCKITLNMGDWDFGSGGVVLLTTSSTTAYGELVAAGKEGMFYVTYYCSGPYTSNQCPVNTWNQLMGGLDGGGYGTDSKSDYRSVTCTVSSSTNPAPGSGDVAQCFYGVPVSTRAESGKRATPAYWSGTTPYLYTVGTHDVVRARAFTPSTGIFHDPADATSSTSYGYPGATPVISSNGTNFSSAVLWVLDTSAFGSGGLDTLTAYAANPNGSSLTQLWTSPSGSGPGSTKFMVPTVANGRVYVAGQSQQSGGCGTTCGGLLVIYH